jgi:hypothetical protein
MNLEALEPRIMLDGAGGESFLVPGPAADLWSVAHVAELFAEDSTSTFLSNKVSGVTVITHGFQIGGAAGGTGGDSLMPLALAIKNQLAQSGQQAWLLDYDLQDEGVTAGFDRYVNGFDLSDSFLPEDDNAAPGELILLFDWAAESNETSDGWGNAAGDALFSLLVNLNVVDPLLGAASDLPIHFIAHSFGTAVTSSAIERLAAFDIPVDHVTYLDPHDFVQGGLFFDSDQELYKLGRPDGYGATVWDNVGFADVYYQTRGNAGAFESFVPLGRPIPGAYNYWMTEQVFDMGNGKWFGGDLPLDNDAIPLLDDDNDYASLNVGGDHSLVWQSLYLSTINGQQSKP